VRSVQRLAGDATVEDQTTRDWAAGEADRKAAAAAKKAKKAAKDAVKKVTRKATA